MRRHHRLREARAPARDADLGGSAGGRAGRQCQRQGCGPVDIRGPHVRARLQDLGAADRVCEDLPLQRRQSRDALHTEVCLAVLGADVARDVSGLVGASGAAGAVSGGVAGGLACAVGPAVLSTSTVVVHRCGGAPTVDQERLGAAAPARAGLAGALAGAHVAVVQRLAERPLQIRFGFRSTPQLTVPNQMKEAPRLPLRQLGLTCLCHDGLQLRGQRRVCEQMTGRVGLARCVALCQCEAPAVPLGGGSTIVGVVDLFGCRRRTAKVWDPGNKAVGPEVAVRHRVLGAAPGAQVRIVSGGPLETGSEPPARPQLARAVCRSVDEAVARGGPQARGIALGPSEARLRGVQHDIRAARE
mmetsp:Transcript_91748/g.153766  ORF Transcript_91748/g.153766 Transcript_91748/m.153766 type:complete len:358 (+) Transcript_91748:1295-2368(+)